MENMGKEKGEYSISQIALAWQLSNPIISSPIIGPRNSEQLEDNLGVVGLRLAEDELEVLNKATDWK
jgi:aryl-alcohol dehydrogenase-like predicted oxidoreductase